MPNWILTNYVFMGNKTELDQLNEQLKKLGSRVEEISLCGVIAHFGGNYKKLPCQGHIVEYFRCSEFFLEVKTITAYTTKHEVWDFVMTKYTDLRYQYTGDCE